MGGALGEQNKKKYRMAVKATMTWAFCISITCSLSYWIFGGLIIDLFTSNEDVRLIANDAIFWVIIIPLVAIWPYMLDGIFIGATRTRDMRNGMVLALIIFISFLNTSFVYITNKNFRFNRQQTTLA